MFSHDRVTLPHARLRRLLQVAGLVAAGAVPAWLVASQVTLPHTFSTGSVADAEEVNANFDALKTAVNAIDAWTAGGDLSGTYPGPSVVGLRGQPISATAPAAGQVLKFSGTQWQPAAEAVPALVFLKDVKSAGSAGGAATAGTWNVRVLNTLENPFAYPWVSLASNRFTLSPGTYEIEAAAPASKASGHKAALYNVTDGAYTMFGTTEYGTPNTVLGDSVNVMSHSWLRGFVVVSGGPKAFEIRHYVGTNNGGAASVFGYATGAAEEIYTTVRLQKLQ